MDNIYFDKPPAYPKSRGSVKPHGYYYFEEGNLVVQVQQTLFKIWDGPLRRNSRFHEKTALGNIDDRKAGSSDDNPWVLQYNVQALEFERLLWVLYPRTIGEYEAKSVQDWVTVLELSTRWSLKDVRALSIKKLAKLQIEPVEKLELLVQYDIEKQWAYSSFIAICSREKSLEFEEGQRIGMELTVKIGSARERLEKWGRKRPDEVKKVVCEIFNVEKE